MAKQPVETARRVDGSAKPGRKSKSRLMRASADRSAPLIVATPITAATIPGAFAFDNSAASRKALAEKARKTGAEWLLFERNEQSGWPLGEINRSLRRGYSSFSGIDYNQLQKQTDVCWKDWLSGKGKVDFKTDGNNKIKASKIKKQKTAASGGTVLQGGNRGTFSLIFDTEQLGGVRFGIPRILRLLERKGVRATFFLTGVVCSAYPGLVSTIRKAGHEVGIHGSCHEHLDGSKPDEQVGKIREALGFTGKANGANYIGRMDKNTPAALKQAGLSYFVFPLKNTKRLIATYCPPLWAAPGLYAVPVFAETYGKPLSAISKQILPTLERAPREGARLTLLAHPFFDGSIARIGILERTIDILQKSGLEGVPINEALPTPSNATGPTLKIRPYGSSSWKGALERIYNGHSTKRYCKALEKGLQPEMVCI